MWEPLSEEVYVNLVLELPLQSHAVGHVLLHRHTLPAHVFPSTFFGPFVIYPSVCGIKFDGRLIFCSDKSVTISQPFLYCFSCLSGVILWWGNALHLSKWISRLVFNASESEDKFRGGGGIRSLILAPHVTKIFNRKQRGHKQQTFMHKHSPYLIFIFIKRYNKEKLVTNNKKKICAFFTLAKSLRYWKIFYCCHA